MRAADLDIHELLHFAPEGGLITFAVNACSCSMPSCSGCSGRSSSRRSARQRREPCSPGSVMHTDGASPKRFVRDFRGTARTNGGPQEHACIRFRVWDAPR